MVIPQDVELDTYNKLKKQREDLAGGKTAVTDSEDFYQLEMMMQKAPDEFDKVDLLKYDLSPADLKYFIKAQADPGDAIKVTEVTQTEYHRALNSIGEDATDFRDKYPEKYAELYVLFQKEIEYYQNLNKGEALTPNQFNDVAAKVFGTVQKEEGFFSSMFGTGEWDVTDIEADRVNGLADILRSHGVTVDADQLRLLNNSYTDLEDKLNDALACKNIPQTTANRMKLFADYYQKAQQ